jgi:hypothetical protein
MKLFPLLFSGILLFGCGSESKKTSPATSDNIEKLRSKYQFYQQQNKTKVDNNGFIETDSCDSLIFSALANVKDVKLTAAELEPGKWLRRPTEYPECYSSGESRSNISRDGLLGVIYWAVYHKDSNTLKRLWDYGESHNWVMGEQGWTHSIYVPDHIALLAQALYYTSNGKYDYTARFVIMPEFTPETGFRAHLQQLQLLIRKKIYNKDESFANKVRQKLKEQNPKNPLHQFLGGDEQVAVQLLLDLFPNDRLPNSSDWCAKWLLEQAPDGNGLKSCPDENVEHSGGDFLFITRLILEREMQ